MFKGIFHRRFLSLAASLALFALVGCSSRTLAPESRLSGSSSSGKFESLVGSSQQNPRHEAAAVASAENLLEETITVEIEFEALILPPNLEASTIQLMHSTTFQNLTAAVDENSDLRGFDNETVALGDFLVCSRGLARGIVTGDDTIQLTYLRMLPN